MQCTHTHTYTRNIHKKTHTQCHLPANVPTLPPTLHPETYLLLIPTLPSLLTVPVKWHMHPLDPTIHQSIHSTIYLSIYYLSIYPNRQTTKRQTKRHRHSFSSRCTTRERPRSGTYRLGKLGPPCAPSRHAVCPFIQRAGQNDEVGATGW